MALRAGEGEVRVHDPARDHPRQLRLRDRSLIPPPAAWLLAGAASVFVAYASAFLPGGAPAFAPWLLIGGTIALIAGLLLAGADRGERRGPAAIVFVGTAVWLMAVFAVVLLLPVEDPANPRMLLGLPLRASLLMYGVGLAPALVVPWLYARLFERHTLSDADLETLNEAIDRAEAAGRRTGRAPSSRPGSHDA